MGNMSYCRFENTLSDLGDCKDALDDFLNGDTDGITGKEQKHAARLVEMCHEILQLIADHDGSTLGEFVDAHDHNMCGAVERVMLEACNEGEDE